MSQQPEMPSFLSEWLKSLPTDQATELHDWIDSDPMSDIKIMHVIGTSHPEIFDVPKEQEGLINPD